MGEGGHCEAVDGRGGLCSTDPSPDLTAFEKFKTRIELMSDIDVYSQQMAESAAVAKALVEKNLGAKQLFLDRYYDENVVNSTVLRDLKVTASRVGGTVVLNRGDRSIVMTATPDEIKFKITPMTKADLPPLSFQSDSQSEEATIKRDDNAHI
jgi:hypothetical protein